MLVTPCGMLILFSETHFAKTWLLDPRAPKVEIPKNIQNLHEKMEKVHVEIGA